MNKLYTAYHNVLKMFIGVSKCEHTRPICATLNAKYCLSAPPQSQCPPTPHWTKITLGLTCDDFTLSLGPLEAEIHAFSDGLSEDWKSQNERAHKFYTACQSMGGHVNFFFPSWKGYLGAYSSQRVTVSDIWNTSKKWFFWLKEAERGWKSDISPLSRKSGWKPSSREEFWHQRI